MFKIEKYQIFVENYLIVFKIIEVMIRNDFERSGLNCGLYLQFFVWLFGNCCQLIIYKYF